MRSQPLRHLRDTVAKHSKGAPIRLGGAPHGSLRSITDPPADLDSLAVAIRPLSNHSPAVTVVAVVAAVPIRTDIGTARANAKFDGVGRGDCPAVSVVSAASARMYRFIGTSSRK